MLKARAGPIQQHMFGGKTLDYSIRNTYTGDMAKETEHLEELRQHCLAAGMGEKMTSIYIRHLGEEKAEDYPAGYMEWCHENGFLAAHAIGLGINPGNSAEFFSDFDYYRVFPLNNWMRMWVNDKLTLKYMLHGTPWQNVMPEYYFYSTPHGLRKLVDNPYDDQTAETVLRLVREHGKIACKPNNGSCSVGFCKLEYSRQTGSYLMNSSPCTEEELVHFINTTPNVIYTEYLTPCPELARIHPKIHTIRVIVINEHGNDPKIAGGYVRFPVNKLGEANYLSARQMGDYTFYTELDLRTGQMFRPSAVYLNKVEAMPTHPDTGYTMREGEPIPHWDELVETALGISRHLFGLEFIGFDLCVAEGGVKLMEINTHPGCNGIQWSHHVFDKTELVRYLRKRLAEKDALLAGTQGNA